MRAGFLELDCLLMGGIVVCRCDEEGSRAICVGERGIEQLDSNQRRLE
jgi:hypothetical protein